MQAKHTLYTVVHHIISYPIPPDSHRIFCALAAENSSLLALLDNFAYALKFLVGNYCNASSILSSSNLHMCILFTALVSV